MKHPALFSLAAAGALLALAPRAAAVNGAETTIKIDEKGTGELSLSFNYDAPSWKKWKANKSEPDMVWRNIRSSYAAFVIDDFSFQDNDVKRTSTIQIKSRCEAEYRGDGEFVYELAKDIKLISDGGGRHWSFSSEVESPLLEMVPHTQHIILPPNAEDARIAGGSSGQELRYTIPRPKGETVYRDEEKSPLLIWLGAGLAGLGAILLPASFMGGRPRPPQQPPYDPPHQPQQQPHPPAVPPQQVETPTSGYEP